MPCYHPNTAYRGRTLNQSGKRSLVFDQSKSLNGVPIPLPCGQCIGCRLEYSRQWAVRCHHEAKLHSSNCFLTLTLNNDNLPNDHSLNVSTFQDFMKRFRKDIEPRKIRFYHSGEYGKATPDNDFIARPHYHALIFNYQFDDRELLSSKEGIHLYTSDHLDHLWTHGNCSVGDLTFESAAYVARYITKKINTSQKSPEDYYLHYTRTDHTTGEIYEIKPEYSTMSRRPGVGAHWFKKFKSDCFPSDSISVRGTKQKPPKYYDYLLELDDSEAHDAIKISRIAKARKHWRDQTPERLVTREIVKLSQIQTLKRSL